MPKNSYLEAIRKKHNETILRVIADQGLFPEAENTERVYSYDENRTNGICYFLVEDPAKKNFDAVNPLSFFGNSSFTLEKPFESMQKGAVDGFWALSLEREFLVTDSRRDAGADRFEWEDRLMSSVLFVLKNPHEEVRHCRKISGMGLNPITQDYATSTGFSPKDILMVLAPKAQFAQVQSIFGAKAIEVPNTIHSTECSKKAFERHHSEYLEGPDYAKVLQNLKDDEKISYPFGLHLTRLSTRRDFLKIPHFMEQLELTACERQFNATDPDVLLRKAAANAEREDVEFLLSQCSSIDINAQSPSTGDTALHWAIKDRCIPRIKSLLRKGARTDIENNATQTAQALAEAMGISLRDILSGEYDKKVFVQRATERLPLFLANMGEIGKYYRSPTGST